MNQLPDPQILMVDDDPNVLAGYRRTVGRTFNVICAEGGAAALLAIGSATQFAVIITDMRMPIMNGLEFINAARVKSPDSIFIMLTGNAQQQTAIDAINQGRIFRFLNKPCSPEVLDESIQAALRQYELVTSERVLLRETFAGSIKLMIEALELSAPELSGLQTSVRQIQQQTCSAIGLKNDWQLSVAASLCLIGLLTVPRSTIKKMLSDETLLQVAASGAKLLSNIPRIKPIVEMIRRQREIVSLLPADLQSASSEMHEMIGAQFLRFAVDLARDEQKTNSRPLALVQLAQSRQYDPRLINALKDATSASPSLERTIDVSTVVAGMIVETDLRKNDGTIFLTRGQEISELAAASLRNFAVQGIVESKITVRDASAVRKPAA